jgi:lactate dehydrogenase-like 2-hydroxyacid dehydrogenase
VLGFDPYAKNLPGYVETVDLEAIWRESHAISLHCPLTTENAKLINATTLAACRDGVILVNTARVDLSTKSHSSKPCARARSLARAWTPLRSSP